LDEGLARITVQPTGGWSLSTQGLARITMQPTGGWSLSSQGLAHFGKPYSNYDIKGFRDIHERNVYIPEPLSAFAVCLPLRSCKALLVKYDQPPVGIEDVFSKPCS